jgi:hypothetical protein
MDDDKEKGHVSDESAEVEFDITRYYHSDTKSLDFSNLPFTNATLKEHWADIKKFVTTAEVKTLLLQNMELKKIPYYIITFALTDKSLEYVSMKGNKFKIANPSSDADLVDAMKTMGLNEKDTKDIDKKLSDLKDTNPRDRSTSVGNIISSLWDLVHPSIQKAIDKQNKTQTDGTHFYKKIIVIDSKIPPITIINKDKLPPSSCEKFKTLAKKLLLVGIGFIMTAAPTLATWLATVDPAYCDMGLMQQYATSCNVTITY